jgi:hypothetical protein
MCVVCKGTFELDTLTPCKYCWEYFMCGEFLLYFIKEPPIIIHGLSSPYKVTAKEGDTVQLLCNVTGVPAPTVTWYKKSSNSRNHNHLEGMN